MAKDPGKDVKTLMAGHFVKAVRTILGRYCGVPLDRVRFETDLPASHPLIHELPDVGFNIAASSENDREAITAIRQGVLKLYRDHGLPLPINQFRKDGMYIGFVSAQFADALRSKFGTEDHPDIEGSLREIDKLTLAVIPTAPGSKPN